MSDQLFRKRKKTIGRPKPTRKEIPRVLILTEGEKTEPLYLQEFCKFLGLLVVVNAVDSAKNICIDGKSFGSDPMSIVKEAKKRLKDKNAGWNKIYCVFDKDQHKTYNQALEELSKFKDKKIEAITSVICFELWFLLHFSNSSKPYEKADDLIHDLKRIKNSNGEMLFSSYQKKQKNTFNLTKDHLEDAKRNADIINKAAKSTRTDNPSTSIVDLINKLEEISKM